MITFYSIGDSLHIDWLYKNCCRVLTITELHVALFLSLSLYSPKNKKVSFYILRTWSTNYWNFFLRLSTPFYTFLHFNMKLACRINIVLYTKVAKQWLKVWSNITAHHAGLIILYISMCLCVIINRAETNIKFYNSNIFQINEQINELFFKNFLNK